MLNKISTALSIAILSMVFAVSSANAIVVSENVTPGFSGNWNHDEIGPIGGINDTFTFTALADTNLKFFSSVNHDQGNPNAAANFGISNLVMTWSIGGVVHTITNALGAVDHLSVPFFHQLTNGQVGVLTITGNFLSGGGGYSLSVAAVPLPPALIAFSTAMLGVGFLARRKRKKSQAFS